MLPRLSYDRQMSAWRERRLINALRGSTLSTPIAPSNVRSVSTMLTSAVVGLDSERRVMSRPIPASEVDVCARGHMSKSRG
jgi:hypothetical protein